MKHVTIVKFYT